MSIETKGYKSQEEELAAKEQELSELMVWVGQRANTSQDGEIIDKLQGDIARLKKDLGR